MKTRDVEEKLFLAAVFDTNIYVAAYLSENPKSPNKELIQRWLNSQFILLVSDSILAEIVNKFIALRIDSALIIELVAQLKVLAEWVEESLKEIKRIIEKDPSDDKIIYCAVKGNADYLVTYDPHFDFLEGIHENVLIVQPLIFLYILRKRWGF